MAGVSATDLRSALSLPAPSQASGSGPSKSASVVLPGAGPQTKTPRKPEGISRELYSLIGPSAPSLTAQLSKPQFKQKPNLGGGGRPSKWEWRPFKNPDRTDGLKLSHWAKASTDPDAEYPFAKYNVPSTAYTYSQDEYNRLLAENGWTKEETDYLFNIVKEYDMRFYVIADRYNYSDGRPRSLEDIKDRYYSVCRRLIRSRPWAGDDASKQQLVSSFAFDKEREITRKKYIVSLENRTPEQIAEEEALYVELKRLEQNERKFAKDRDDLLRLLAGVESGLPSIANDDDMYQTLFTDKGLKKKRAGSGFEGDSPMTAGPSGTISLGTPVTATKKVQSAKAQANDAQHCIHRHEQTVPPTTKAAHQAVYLRSNKITGPKAAQAAKVNQALTELGISYSRLVMPTRENIAQLEGLFEAAGALVETKKVVDRVDQEIRVLKAKAAGRTSVGAGSPEGANDNDANKDKDEEADGEADGDFEADKGRASSVAASIQSTGRKRGRRSMSISSVDTIATRASRKRQKV